MSVRCSISSGTVIIEADSAFATSAVHVSHLDLVKRTHHVLSPRDAYRIDLCITPRLPSRMRFFRWAADRFERPGRIFVVPPKETLAVWNDLGQETVIVAHIFTEAMTRWFGESDDLCADPLDSSADVPNPAIEQLMLRLREEVRAPGFAPEIMIEGLTMQLAVELRRHYRNVASPRSSPGLAPWRLRRIEERVRSLDQPATLSQLAGLCGLSVRQLSRGFLASRGMSIGHYVAQTRMEHAKQLLLIDRSIKSVAFHLGYSSSAAFCAAFRKSTGMAPTSYRSMVF